METTIVFKPQIARQLLKLGHTIIDIKQHRDNKDKTVFVFQSNDKFKTDLKELSSINN